jgi:hypothetical protein
MGCLKTAYSWWRHYSKSGMFVFIIVGLALIVVGLALIVVGLALIVVDNDKKCILFFSFLKWVLQTFVSWVSMS